MYPSLATKTASKANMNLQDSFLNHARKENLTLTLLLINGIQITGKVKGFDNFTVIMENDEGQQMIYKHGILSVKSSSSIIVMPTEKHE